MGAAMARGMVGRGAGMAMAGALALSAAGCQTAGGGGRSALDDAVGRCVASTLGMALVGGIIGAAAGGGGRNVAIGAGAGAAVGGLACAVMTALDAQDKERIRQAQIQAAQTGETRYLSYQGSDGRARRVVVKPQATETASAGRICRRADTTAAIGDAGSTELPAQLICRTPGGDWLPA
jgi:hypothetical protein